MTKTAVQADAAKETGAERTGRHQVNERALERRQEALFTLAKKSVRDPADIQPLVWETAAIVADALEATRGAYAELVKDAWSLRLLPPGNTPAGGFIELKLRDEANESFARFVAQHAKAGVCEDLLVEQRFSDAALLDQGLRSGVMCPLVNDGEVLGVLAVLAGSPRDYAPSEVRFLETVAQWLTLIIARGQTEHELARLRRFAETLTSTVDALVVELDPQGQIQWVNPACESITGFLPDELKERTLWNALLIPDEMSLVKEVFARLKTESEMLDFDSHVLTKHGERRRMAWSCSAIRDADGKIHSILGTGLDVTDKLHAEQELKKLRHDADANQAAPTVEPRSGANAPPRSEPRRASEMPQPFAAPKPAMPWVTPEVTVLPHGVKQDRRSRPRCAYPYKQLIAPFYNGRLPARSLFKEMQCREIAAGGFSYLAPMPPDNDIIVVAFGVAPSLIYLSAKVQHVTPIDADGIAMFAVGCQYLERVSYNGR